MREQLTLLGCRLREIRKKRGMTLQELGQKTGVTAGLLSKIENFRTVPSLPALVTIARALGADLGELFAGLSCDTGSQWLLIHPEEQQSVERDPEHGLRYRMALELPMEAGTMQAMLVSGGEGKAREPVTTEADQLTYVLKGCFAYVIGEDTLELAPGDLLYFNGRLLHGPLHKPGQEIEMFCLYFLH